MKYLKPVFGHLLSALTGVVFLYSAYTKLYPVIETFEFTFVDIGLANWYAAPVIARVFIALEFFIGVLLVAGYNLKKFTIPFTFILLIVFNIYLLLLILLSGNEGNCGCFGEHHRMSPLQAIIKNLVLMAGLAITYFIYQGWKTSYHKLLMSLLAVSLCALPFIINPIDYNYTSNNVNETVNYYLDLEPLYQSQDSSRCEIPKAELRKGKQVIALLSLTCSHCRIAAKKFRVIKKNNPSIPVYFILNGDSVAYRDFMKDTQTENIPSSFCFGKTFINLASFQLPRIYYLDNSIVVKKVDYFELSQDQIEEWLEVKDK